MLAKEMSENSLKPSVLNMSYQEFLEWSDEDVYAEWVNGEVIIQTPPKISSSSAGRISARIIEFLCTLI
jgi:Uma2 family endonuclease